MTTDTTVSDTEQEQRDFNSGFEPDPAPVIPAKVEPEPKVEPKPEPKAEPKTDAKSPAEAKPKPPEYVQITKEQFETLQSAATKTAAMETQFSKVFGTMGDLQQVVKKIQAGTPVGQPVELPKISFAKMRKDFPEMADLLEGDMTEALKGLRGTGTTATTDADPDALNKLVQAATLKLESEALHDAHPTWREIVGAYGDETNPFRKWLGTQDAAYRTRLNNTNSSTVISRAIDKFLAATAPAKAAPEPAPKVAARIDRIRSAIQPKGDGNQPGPSKTADDDFRAGFASG